MPDNVGLQIEIEGQDAGVGQAASKVKVEIRDLRREIDRAEDSTESFNKDMQDSVSTLANWGAAAGGVALSGATALVKTYTDGAIELERWSKVLNTQPAELRVISGVTRQYNLELEDTADFLKEIQNRAFDATTGNRSYAEAFERLGIDFQRFLRLEPTEQLLALSNAFDRLDRDSAIFLFEEIAGDVGARFISVLDQGEDSLRGMIDRQRELNTVTNDQVRDLAELRREWDEIVIIFENEVFRAISENKDEIRELAQLIAENLPEALMTSTDALKIFIENWEILLGLFVATKVAPMLRLLTALKGASPAALAVAASAAGVAVGGTALVSTAELINAGRDNVTQQDLDNIASDIVAGIQVAAENAAEEIAQQQPEGPPPTFFEAQRSGQGIPQFQADPFRRYRDSSVFIAPLTEFELKSMELAATVRSLEFLSPEQRDAIAEMALRREQETAATRSAITVNDDLVRSLRDNELGYIRTQEIWMDLQNASSNAVGSIVRAFFDGTDDIAGHILNTFADLALQIGSDILGDIVGRSIFGGLINAPGFQQGGFFGGGLRLVGEDGPELEFTGPSRILSNRDTENLLGRREIALSFAPVINTSDTALVLKVLRDYEPEFLDRAKRALVYDSDFQRGYAI